MMRVCGGSIFSKISRREMSSSGSRVHNFSSLSYKEVDNVSGAILHILAAFTISGGFAFGGYKYAHYISPYDPESYASQRKLFQSKCRNFFKKLDALDKKEAWLDDVKVQRSKKIDEYFKQLDEYLKKFDKVEE